MKPLYWKFLLIVGAMIVGASLVVPKALRKNAPQGADNTSQTLFLPISNQATLFGVFASQDKAIATVIDEVKAQSSLYNASFDNLGFLVVARFTAEVEAPLYSLNAGTRPTKSRVID